ncbi:MAG: hypothetical protein ACOX2U_00225 [Limisphaerales bacterium]|mgnify:FL=1|jgi:hypothetical protein|nr:hypothetical protein [Verrucomicrobiota bacterium]
MADPILLNALSMNLPMGAALEEASATVHHALGRLKEITEASNASALMKKMALGVSQRPAMELPPVTPAMNLLLVPS